MKSIHHLPSYVYAHTIMMQSYIFYLNTGLFFIDGIIKSVLIDKKKEVYSKNKIGTNFHMKNNTRRILLHL